MPRPQLAYDGLWRCLSPAAHKRGLPRALNTLVLGERLGQQPQRLDITQSRQFGVSKIRGAQSPESPGRLQSLDSFFNEFELRQIDERNKKEAQIDMELRQKEQKAQLKTSKNPALAPVLPNLDNVSTPLIVEALRRLRLPKQAGNDMLPDNRFSRIVNIVRYLVKFREYPLDALIYESMLAAMAAPSGSSGGIRRILADMRDQNIPLSADVCYLALEALTVHPEYVLRQEVMEIMDKHWFEYTMSAKQNIAVAMLREGQHELAMDKIAQLMNEAEHIDLWVYDVFILEYGRLGFFDEMLYLFKQRKHAKGTDSSFRNIQLMALDMFSQGFHHAGTLFVWADVIKTSIHNPSNGILENVLATAARHGDANLATEALDKLSKRGKLDQYHHDAIVEAFANAGDVEGAFVTLNTLQNAGWVVDQGTTRPILQALLRDVALIHKSVYAIHIMHKEGPVALDAVMVTVEALARTRTSEAAMPLFRDTYRFTGRNPRCSDIEKLLRYCVDMEAKYELAKAYNAEIAKMDLVPGTPAQDVVSAQDESGQGDIDLDVTVSKSWMDRADAAAAYNIIIPACAEKGDFELAFKFIGLAKAATLESIKVSSDRRVPGSTLWRSSGWVEPFVKKALDAEHPRVWELVDELDQGDDAPALMIRQELQRRRINKRVEQRAG
ncbi:Ff.00g027600.m01.CDS01 [Fusarium sp. VM40]|nr:Ff.00g027600.m01.CDS01 [Fusarium sp. VM40]